MTRILVMFLLFLLLLYIFQACRFLKSFQQATRYTIALDLHLEKIPFPYLFIVYYGHKFIVCTVQAYASDFMNVLGHNSYSSQTYKAYWQTHLNHIWKKQNQPNHIRPQVYSL